MIKSNKFVITAILVFSLLAFGFAQNCPLKLSGYVEDLGTGLPLESVAIYIEEIGKGTITDTSGFFQLTDLCPAEYHIVFSHISCEPQQFFIHLEKDTLLQITMEHSVNVLDGVIVIGKTKPNSTQNSLVINEQSISDNANQNLSNMLESISGVSTLRNGNGISKPVIHGLYGNRLTILNNGVAQSGQQWGNDHSPEIDPLVANKIRVIKGVSALKFSGSNLGSVVLVEPQKIGREPHLHGKASYFFESNGFSNNINLQLQQYAPSIAWKINGTLKKGGDRKTAEYYLNNTGNQEANFALQLEKSFSTKFFTDLYFSTFNTELGVLRGAHIGNLTDLEEAFSREIPFFTEDKFSYNIDAPKQKVNHQLLKIRTQYFIKNDEWLDFTFAGQLNNRKEFDVRRSGRSEIPSLSLKQFSYFLEGKYHKYFKHEVNLNTGLQINIVNNTNNPETGILPLIPDYLAYESGVFVVLTQKIKKSFFEIGVRYDNIVQNVVTITQTTPREIVRYTNTFHNFSSSGGWTYELNKDLKLSYNIGYATRNPAINELYSGGLHQGVSGIEEGNTSLRSEKSLKSTLAISGELKKKLSFEALFYYQRINNYIYLNPQDEIRLTIRGAFPVFKYEQTDAQIYGLDVSGQFQITKTLSSKLTYSLIKGNDLNYEIPLINMPSNNLTARIGYEFYAPINIGKKQLENVAMEIESKYVFKQNNLLANQDFILPPEGYNLFSFKVATDIQLSKTRLRFFAKVDNLFNITYRDYLNRQRYFSNDLGVNATFGVRIMF